MPQCQPVLLEPIHVVEIVCPTDATAKINAILSARRGQILGFDTREGWAGWDCVRATMPEAEIGELIVELRSATAGAGSFTRQFDHMAEVTGRRPTRSSPPIASRREPGSSHLCLLIRRPRAADLLGHRALNLPDDVFYIIVIVSDIIYNVIR